MIAALLVNSATAFAFDKSSGRKAQDKGEAEIPICTKRLGTVAIVEPDTNWWQQLGLGSPEAVIKVFVMKSGRFGLVDRGKGPASRNIERALADSGELQQGSNIGRKQVKAADYFIVPDIVSKNSNSGGSMSARRWAAFWVVAPLAASSVASGSARRKRTSRSPWSMRARPSRSG